MALKLWNNRSAHGETREWAKAARAPFPSDARPRSIIANGGPGSHSTSRVGALVAEWILGDGWRNVVTTSSPTSSLATNILYRSLHLHIPPPRQGFKLKKWQTGKDNLQMHLLEIAWGPQLKTSFNSHDCLKHHHPWVLKRHPQSSLCAGRRGAFADK